MSNSYNQHLYQQENILTVGAVQIPGLIQLDGEDWEGPIVELLRAITRKIPWIKAIKIISETNIGNLLSIGQVAIDITPTALCVQNGVPQGTAGFGYLAIGRATQFNGTLIYLQSAGHGTLRCRCPPSSSVACTISSATPSNVLAVLSSNTSISLYASDNFAAMAASCGGYPTDAIITLPTTGVPAVSNPATGASIANFFDRANHTSTVCLIVLYLDEALTSSQIAEINAEGSSAGYVFDYITPTSSVLSYVWTFNDYASHLQLWFQFALDQVVASGEYNAIITAGGLDGSNRSNQDEQHHHSGSDPLVLPFRPPPVQYSIKKGFIPRAALYETLLPKLCCYEAKGPVKVLSTEECPEEVAPPPDNDS